MVSGTADQRYLHLSAPQAGSDSLAPGDEQEAIPQ
jgi:hypothetical protein